MSEYKNNKLFNLIQKVTIMSIKSNSLSIEDLIKLLTASKGIPKILNKVKHLVGRIKVCSYILTEIGSKLKKSNF